VVQRFLATLLILAGLGGIGYGVATATVLRESDTVVATATPSGDGTMVVTEPGVLGLVDDQVTVRATVPEGQKVTLALGSDVDVLGWVGDDPYDSVTGLSSWEALSVVPGTGLATDEETDGEETDDAPAKKPSTGPDPAGSDMWISEVSGETTAQLRWTEEPGRVVLLAAGVGKNAEAPTLELTWPRPVNTPYLWPGVLGGGFALILGIFMAIGARRGKKGGKKGSSSKGRSQSAVRTRQPDSELPRRDAVFGVDGEQSSPAGHEPAAGFPPALGDPTDGGTSVFPPAAPLRPGRGAQEQPAPEPERTQAWGPPHRSAERLRSPRRRRSRLPRPSRSPHQPPRSAGSGAAAVRRPRERLPRPLPRPRPSGRRSVAPPRSSSHRRRPRCLPLPSPPSPPRPPPRRRASR